MNPNNTKIDDVSSINENDAVPSKKYFVQSTLSEITSCSILPGEEDMHVVYTIGYEGLNLEEFVDRLKGCGIQRLIDVRERASSRKKGFSKTALKERLEEVDVEYIHLRALGAPPEIRYEYRGGGSEKVFFERYTKHIQEEVPEEVTVMKKYVTEKPSALMCFESSHTRCHRRILAEELKDSGFSVKHL